MKFNIQEIYVSGFANSEQPCLPAGSNAFIGYDAGHNETGGNKQ